MIEDRLVGEANDLVLDSPKFSPKDAIRKALELSKKIIEKK